MNNKAPYNHQDQKFPFDCATIAGIKPSNAQIMIKSIIGNTPYRLWINHKENYYMVNAE